MAVDELPSFRFHPDPVATGAVRSSDSSCRCCGQARGFVVGHVYAEEALDEAVCPWCVANGTAAREFGATFVQYLEGGVSASDADEVLNRTPGYESWQGEYWLVHCRVPMVYYGDLAKDELRSLASDIRDRFVSENEYLFEDEPWPAVVRSYEPGGQMGLYKFACSACGTFRLGCDFA